MKSPNFACAWFLFLFAQLLCSNEGVSHGAVIFFEPSGSQLGSGSTNAIWLGVGEEQSFSIFLNTSGLQFELQSITYQWSVDQTELQFVSYARNIDGAFSNFYESPVVPPMPPSGSFNFVDNYTLEGGAVAPGMSRVVLDSVTYLGTSQIRNDGLPDIRLEIISAFDVMQNDITTQFMPSAQEVHVLPTPEPASVLLWSAVLAGTLGGRWRRHNYKNRANLSVKSSCSGQTYIG